jgi:predicted nuclease of predicted toxin-antitoxin system
VKFLFDHDVPDDMAYVLTTLGHEVFKLRELIHPQTTDEEVLHFAAKNNYVLITCNRDDFLAAAQKISHAGLIVLIRRSARVRERVALLRLLDKAGEQGIRENINFA